MNLSKEFKRIKAKAKLYEAYWTYITPELATELLQRREFLREYDWDMVVCLAFEYLAGFSIERDIAINYDTNALRGGSSQLMGFLISGKSKMKVPVIFSEDNPMIQIVLPVHP